MGTFHSVFARILRSEADKIGYPRSFTIYDTQDSKTLIGQILKELELDDKMYKPNMVLSRDFGGQEQAHFGAAVPQRPGDKTGR